MLECGSELSVGCVRIRNESVKHDSSPFKSKPADRQKMGYLRVQALPPNASRMVKAALKDLA
jgi:hypothetical protein